MARVAKWTLSGAAAAACLVAVCAAAKPSLQQAADALERCLVAHSAEPWRCATAASAFCDGSDAVACRRFEIGAWRRVGDRANARLIAAAGRPADQAFAAEASADLESRNQAECAAQGRQDRRRAQEAEWACRRDAAARRMTALWLIAPRR